MSTYYLFPDTREEFVELHAIGKATMAYREMTQPIVGTTHHDDQALFRCFALVGDAITGGVEELEATPA